MNKAVSAKNSLKKIPLAVDFDGTMHLGDLAVMGFKWLLRRNPLAAALVLARWPLAGKAAMKLALQARVLKVWQPTLQWDLRVLALMAKARTEGREVIVATGSTTKLVEEILRRSGMDYEVMGTEQIGVNLVRERKAAALMRRWGEKGFDYAGNSPDDLLVWPHAHAALVVNADASTLAKARALGNVETVLPPESAADVCGCC